MGVSLSLGQMDVSSLFEPRTDGCIRVTMLSLN